jgi:hypothetical protein
MKFELSQQILGKYSNIKFYENSSREPSCSMWAERQMERCDKANSQFCNFANTPENYEKLVRKIIIMDM